jgi:hypothetical protein
MKNKSVKTLVKPGKKGYSFTAWTNANRQRRDYE